MSTYSLPKLRYDYAALEPHIAKRVLELHHSGHHSAYVKKANLVLAELDKAREQSETSHIAALEKALAFNVSGHVLHSIFWQNLSPRGGGRPDGELAKTIDRDFGSFDKFRWQLTQAAETIMGSGWSALLWEPLGGKLVVAQIHDHQSDFTAAGLPLLVLDAWEHAYYLQYENRKADFFRAVWNLWSWPDVAERFAAAKKLDLLGLGVPAP